MAVFCIIGKSGVGKTTIFNCVRKDLNIPTTVPYTTRPIRPHEREFKDYIFLSDIMWGQLGKEDVFIAQQTFKVANGEVWKYAFNKEDFKNHDNIIIVGTPEVINLLRKEGIEVISIKIVTNEFKRIIRLFIRKDNQGLKEMFRRFFSDRNDFKMFKAEYTVKNNELNSCLKQIKNIINTKKA